MVLLTLTSLGAQGLRWRELSYFSGPHTFLRRELESGGKFKTFSFAGRGIVGAALPEACVYGKDPSGC